MLIYLSHVVSESTPVYGGGVGAKIVRNRAIEQGDGCNTQLWELPNHVGTHIDAPRHFFADGPTIDSYPPEFWICNNVAFVTIHLEAARWIGVEDMRGKFRMDADCLIIKTGFQKWRGGDVYCLDNPGLSAGLAEWLRENCPNLRFIGMDFISVSRFSDREGGRAAHREFLNPPLTGNPILPVEDMDLSLLHDGQRIDSILLVPVRVAATDGSPVTVIAEIS